MKSYEIERLLDRETTPMRNGQIRVRYLVRWKGYGPEDDQWRKLSKLGNADDLVTEYNNNHPSTLSFSPLVTTKAQRRPGRPRKHLAI